MIKISVITVCYNAVLGIRKTIQSVLSQTYHDIEYIIIDGGSTDGTVEIIREYEDRIAYFVSEPDDGIYYAMNKGIDVATGEMISFLNAGDIYYSNYTIASVFSHYSTKEFADVIYCYQVHSYPYGKYVRKHLPLSSFCSCMPFGHESCFVKTSIMKERKYDTTFRIAADYHFFFQLYVSGYRFESVEELVAVFESMEGASTSDNTALLTLYETAKINGSISSFRYKKALIRTYVAITIKSIIRRLSPTFVEKRQRLHREQNDEYLPLNVFLSNHHD